MNTGALIDKTDIRDYPINDFITTTKLPSRFDLREQILEVRSQGSEGSCVGFASCAMKEYFEGMQLSPRFLYDMIKLPTGGSYPRDAMKVLLSTGVPDEECQLYIPNIITEQCPNILVRAKANKIKGYARLDTEEEMKRSLVDNGPFLISLRVYESWYNTDSGAVKQIGIEKGLHAVTVVGYDDSTRTFCFKNSWGSGWGDSGYGYVHYGDISRTMNDCWSIVDIPDNEEYGYTLPKTFIQKILNFILSLFKR